MASIEENIRQLKEQLPPGVRLVAVSKYHSEESIIRAYSCGQRIFGESYVKELLTKHETLPKDIEWHFIGHLQTNKVRFIVPFISMIHSIDSERLINEVQKQAFKCGRIVDTLLELHIAGETTKSGFTLGDCTALLATRPKERYPNVRICGLMMMASNTDDEKTTDIEFAAAADYFDFAKERYFAGDSCFCERSWGMSNDYPAAIRHRSTFVRIGTKIFGERRKTT